MEQNSASTLTEANIYLETVVLDTSAIRDERVFTIIDHAKHIVISSLVLREINHIKDISTDLGTRKKYQKILKECAIDVNNEKYKILELLRQNSECTDEAIARYTSKLDNATVVTCDYGLCCFCKLYNVGYVLFSSEIPSIVQSIKSVTTIPSNSKDVFFLTRDEGRLNITCTKGTIEVKRKNGTVEIVNPEQKTELFEGDYVTVKVKKESRYIVEMSKDKLILKPLP